MDLGPQFRLFCLALRSPQSPDDIRELRSLAAGVRDWRFIVTAAQRHRVAPFLLAGLKACDLPQAPARVPAQVPAEIIDELRRLSVAGAQRSLAQVAEIVRLCRLFTEAGIPV